MKPVVEFSEVEQYIGTFLAGEIEFTEIEGVDYTYVVVLMYESMNDHNKNCIIRVPYSIEKFPVTIY